MSKNPTTADPETTQERVLTVRVAPTEESFDELQERFEALDAGEEPEPMYEVVLRREVDLNRLLSEKNVELLRTIAREEPKSIRETARLVERDVHQVHDNLSDLEQLNLIRFENDGRANRPVVWYDSIDIKLPIGSSDPSALPA